MTPSELEAAARKRYDACPTVKPTWDQLGDVTRSLLLLGVLWAVLLTWYLL